METQAFVPDGEGGVIALHSEDVIDVDEQLAATGTCSQPPAKRSRFFTVMTVRDMTFPKRSFGA